MPLYVYYYCIWLRENGNADRNWTLLKIVYFMPKGVKIVLDLFNKLVCNIWNFLI